MNVHEELQLPREVEWAVVPGAGETTLNSVGDIIGLIEERRTQSLRWTMAAISKLAVLPERIKGLYPNQNQEEIERTIQSILNIKNPGKSPKLHLIDPKNPLARTSPEINKMEVGQMMALLSDQNPLDLIRALRETPTSLLSENRVVLTPCGISYYPRKALKWGWGNSKKEYPLEGGVIQITYLTIGMSTGPKGLDYLRLHPGIVMIPTWDQEAERTIAEFKRAMTKSAKTRKRSTAEQMRSAHGGFVVKNI